MRIDAIRPTNFKGGVNINAAQNKECKYLYNKLLALTNEYKIPANFRTYEVELPTVTKVIIEKLNELGIKFSNK